MSIFFAVSGYGLICSAKKELDISFITRRLFNVYFPYLLIEIVVNIVNGREWNLLNLLYLLLGLDAWFVFVILLFYLIFYLVWKYCERKLFLMWIGILLVSMLLALCTEDSTWYSSNFAFGVGIVVNVYYKQFANLVSRYRVLWFSMLTACFAGSAVIYMLAMNKNQILYIGFKVLASVLWAVLVLSCVTQVKMQYGKVIKILGNASLECYLLHPMILTVIGNKMNEPMAAVVVSILTSVVVACVIHYLYRILLARIVTCRKRNNGSVVKTKINFL